MTRAAEHQSRWPVLPALLTGGYATVIAMAPNWRVAAALGAPLVLIPLFWWTLQNTTRWLALFFFATLLLPPLPFRIGSTGPQVALLAAALGLAIGVLRRGEWRLLDEPLARRMWLWLAILAVSLAPALLTAGPEVAAASAVRIALLGISVYVFFYVAYGPVNGADEFRALRMVFVLGVAAAIFACVDFYFQFPPPAGYGAQFVWLGSGVYRRAQGVFYDASMLGNLCAFFLTMIAVALFRPAKERPLSRWMLLAGGLIIGAALVLSYSRASLVNLFVGACTLVYLQRERFRTGRFLAYALAATGGGVLIVSLAFPVFAEHYWLRLSNSALYFVQSPNGILSGRLATWRRLLSFLADHPWHAVLGLGYKTLPYSNFLGQTVIPDNGYLSMLAETGIFGLFAMLALSLEILRVSRRAAESADDRASFFGSWMFCFWAGEMAQMLSGDVLTYWRVLPLYFWVLALAARRR